MGAEGYAIERHAYEVTRYALPRADGSFASTPLKVAFMSDFHRSHTTSRAVIAAAVQECNTEKPDVVLLGGDFVSDDADLAPDCAGALAELRAPGGVFFVLGNHDYWHEPKHIREAMRKVGFVDLTNRNTRPADDVVLCGIDDEWTGTPDVSGAFRGAGKSTRVVFSHNPLIFPKIRDRRCVVVCGHTHGGQINIPLVPNPYLSRWKYVQGWFHEQGSSMYVNRGVGTLTLPIRFRCRPEITVLAV